VEALRWLSGRDRRLIAWNDQSKLWGPTTLGSAIVASSLAINDALAYKQVSHIPLYPTQLLQISSAAAKPTLCSVDRDVGLMMPSQMTLISPPTSL
jgi:hypothetical protein